jgi:2-oxoglutarate ferredoxin oxidoreductase subunit beta
VIEILSECVEFYPGAFDSGNPRKGGAFTLIDEKRNDGTPEDELRHDTSSVGKAYSLAALAWPGVFGVFYETKRPTKNTLERGLIADSRAKVEGKSDLEILQSSFARLR